MKQGAEVFRRTYRPSAPKRFYVVVVYTMATTSLVLRMALDGAVPLFVTIPVALLFVALLVMLAMAMFGSKTVADENGVTIRPVFGTRSLPWSDVQGIEIHTNPNAAAPGRQPRFIAVVYDTAGRRFMLPHMTERTVPGLEQEVATLRAVWAARRGGDWAPAPAVVDRITRDRKRPLPAALVALTACLIAFLAALVLFVIVLAAGGYSDADSFASRVLTPVVLIMGIPCATYVVALVVIVGRRRADRHES